MTGPLHGFILRTQQTVMKTIFLSMWNSKVRYNNALFSARFYLLTSYVFCWGTEKVCINILNLLVMIYELFWVISENISGGVVILMAASPSWRGWYLWSSCIVGRVPHFREAHERWLLSLSGSSVCPSRLLLLPLHHVFHTQEHSVCVNDHNYTSGRKGSLLSSLSLSISLPHLSCSPATHAQTNTQTVQLCKNMQTHKITFTHTSWRSNCVSFLLRIDQRVCSNLHLISAEQKITERDPFSAKCWLPSVWMWRMLMALSQSSVMKYPRSSSIFPPFGTSS